MFKSWFLGTDFLSYCSINFNYLNNNYHYYFSLKCDKIDIKILRVSLYKGRNDVLMKIQNRWIIIFASWLSNVMIGTAYAWSVFQPRLVEMFGYTTTQASLAFTLSLGLLPFVMIIVGKIQAKIGVRLTILIGGLIFGTGFSLAGFSTENIITLYLTYGVLCGIGIGFVYGCAVPNSVKWFPDKRGLAGGIIASGFGGGAVIFTPLFRGAVESIGLLETFRYFGIGFAVVIVLASLFISAPPPDFAPEGWTPPASGAGNSITDLTVTNMLKTHRFYTLFVIYTLACVTGLMIIAHAGHIAEVRIGVTPSLAATSVVLLGIANTTGRLFWGAVSDKIGRYPALTLMYTMTAAMLVSLIFATGYGMFAISVMGIGLCFGGFLGVFPSICAENFGTANLGMNYGVLFIAFGIASFVGPRLAASLFESSGSHTTAFVIATFLSVIALGITIIMITFQKKKKPA